MAMSQAGRFLRRTGKADGHWSGGFSHWCPACRASHQFAVDAPNASGAIWTFDGNLLLPTFAPSMNIAWGNRVDPKCEHGGGVCHYNLTAGQIIFCADSTHELAGKTVPLPPLPGHLKD